MVRLAGVAVNLGDQLEATGAQEPVELKQDLRLKEVPDAALIPNRPLRRDQDLVDLIPFGAQPDAEALQALLAKVTKGSVGLRYHR